MGLVHVQCTSMYYTLSQQDVDLLTGGMNVPGYISRGYNLVIGILNSLVFKLCNVYKELNSSYDNLCYVYNSKEFNSSI